MRYTNPPEDTLVSEISIGSDDAVRTLRAKFLNESRPRWQDRTFKNMFVMSGKTFPKEATELAAQRMQQFNTFAKRAGDDIKIFLG